VEIIRRENAINIPNLLTVLRIGLLPIVVYFFCQGDLLGSLAFYLAAMLTDAVDGFAARRLNQVTVLGMLLYPIADKLFELTLLLLFAFAGCISAWVAVLVLFKEIVLIAGSAAALHSGFVVRALPIGKISTLVFVFYVIAQLLSFRVVADILTYVFVLLSLFSLTCYGIKWFLNMHVKKANA